MKILFLLAGLGTLIIFALIFMVIFLCVQHLFDSISFVYRIKKYVNFTENVSLWRYVKLWAYHLSHPCTLARFQDGSVIYFSHFDSHLDVISKNQYNGEVTTDYEFIEDHEDEFDNF